jgi:predicted nucleic acid-binding protein
VKVTVDINVLLDVFQKREPHYAASARVLAMIQQGELTGVFPAHYENHGDSGPGCGAHLA